MLLTPERIERLNRAGLDYLQISIDNARPDEISKKSLQVLDRKLEWLAEHAEFGITINSVLGAGVRNPEDALAVSGRARSLGFTSTVGILHDHSGQLKPLGQDHQRFTSGFASIKAPYFHSPISIAFRRTSAVGCPMPGTAGPAGGSYTFAKTDWCIIARSSGASRGFLWKNTRWKTCRREAARPKGCAPFCTISCVHQTAMLDDFRERPRETLAGILDRRREADPGFRPPVAVRVLSWMFLDQRRRGFFGKLMLRALGIKKKRECTDSNAASI